ncbi:MAG: SWI/SNF-related matrix-associated actin-dependent regulator of chromatin subfamily A-like protein 1, partial [Solirubrobacteraceae bacterium]|nr:SWI/SNF-related matrix-associated actin-dependent regulator of chromatin subfamily A-like protein 1 [Solirubrobacteraceae bacterium]
NSAVKRLPGRWFNWETREWTVLCRPESAEEIAEMLACFPRVEVAPDVSTWLSDAAGWQGIVAVWDNGDGAKLGLRLLSGVPPQELGALVEQAHGGSIVVPLDAGIARLVSELEEIELDPVAEAAIRGELDGRPPPGATLTLGANEDGVERFELFVGTRVDAAVDFRKLTEAHRADWRQGRFARPDQQEVLAVPADAALLDELDEFVEDHDFVWVTPEAEDLRAELRTERRRAKATVALSMAEDAELEIPGLGGELRPFQRAGVQYALTQRRTFLADEQGLGKTVQALAALEHDKAYPAVVVCPASMKLTWAREAGHWLPHRTVAVLSGRSERGWVAAEADAADIVVLNYEIVDGHLERLRDMGPRAGVFDESHYCKEPRAKRTKACIALARGVHKEGLRLALTGTPVLNRPKELVSQLRLIGRLRDFDSGAGMARRFKGRDALERLHWHLRSHCYVRRLKVDVLPQLPPKEQVTIPVELSNEGEYRLAERDLVAWLRAQPLDLGDYEARVAAAMRNERLVRLNRLRQLAGRGKLDAAFSWVHDFLESGEPLVVFADHVAVQKAMVERFPGAVHVLGDDNTQARDDAVQAFQREDGPQLIVCSLRAAGQGITLTRASNVAFLELDWTPARLAQAEDRCHRIGQEDSVTAWYLLAPDTIDETMADVLAWKRGVIGAVTDGRYVEGESLVEAVVRELRERVEDGDAQRAA